MGHVEKETEALQHLTEQVIVDESTRFSHMLEISASRSSHNESTEQMDILLSSICLHLQLLSARVRHISPQKSVNVSGENGQQRAKSNKIPGTLVLEDVTGIHLLKSQCSLSLEGVASHSLKRIRLLEVCKETQQIGYAQGITRPLPHVMTNG